MRIAILCQGNRTAGGRSVGVNFVKQLKDVAATHQYLVVIPPNAGYEELELPPESEIYVNRTGESSFDRWRFEKYHLPKVVEQFTPDIVFGMGNLGLVNPPCKQALLFHRAQLLYPREHLIGFGLKSTLVERIFKARMRKCLPHTQLVFCQTPIMRERFVATFSFPIENIELVPNAVSKFAQVPRDQVRTPGESRGTQGAGNNAWSWHPPGGG